MRDFVSHALPTPLASAAKADGYARAQACGRACHLASCTTSGAARHRCCCPWQFAPPLAPCACTPLRACAIAPQHPRRQTPICSAPIIARAFRQRCGCRASWEQWPGAPLDSAAPDVALPDGHARSQDRQRLPAPALALPDATACASVYGSAPDATTRASAGGSAPPRRPSPPAPRALPPPARAGGRARARRPCWRPRCARREWSARPGQT